MLTNSVAAGVLGAAYLTVLVLQLNPQVPLLSMTTWRWFLTLAMFYGLHLAVVFYVLMVAREFFSLDVLSPGGTFVAKVFQGGTEHELLHMLKRHFRTTFHAKPPSSRANSAEAYLIAKGFKGEKDTHPGEGEYDR